METGKGDRRGGSFLRRVLDGKKARPVGCVIQWIRYVFSEEVSCQYQGLAGGVTTTYPPATDKRASWLWRALLNSDEVHLALIFANAGQKPVAGLKPEPVLGGNYSIIVAGGRHFE